MNMGVRISIAGLVSIIIPTTIRNKFIAIKNNTLLLNRPPIDAAIS